MDFAFLVTFLEILCLGLFVTIQGTNFVHNGIGKEPWKGVEGYGP